MLYVTIALQWETTVDYLETNTYYSKYLIDEE